MKAHKLSHQNLFKRLESQFEAASPEKWRAAAEKLLKGKSFDNALLTETIEAIVLQPIYWQADVEDLKFTKSLPGFAPHVRGRRASGHVAARWEVAQEIAEQLPADFNKALRHDLARGQTAINLRLNHATLLARDIDQHESAADEQRVPFSILQDFMPLPVHPAFFLRAFSQRFVKKITLIWRLCVEELAAIRWVNWRVSGNCLRR